MVLHVLHFGEALLSSFIAVVSALVPPPHLYFQIWYCFHSLALFFCAASFAFADLAHHLQLYMSFMVEGSHSLHIGSHWRFDDKDNSDGPLLTKLEQLILGHKDLGSFSHTPLHNVAVDELSGGLPHTKLSTGGVEGPVCPFALHLVDIFLKATKDVQVCINTK